MLVAFVIATVAVCFAAIRLAVVRNACGDEPLESADAKTRFATAAWAVAVYLLAVACFRFGDLLGLLSAAAAAVLYLKIRLRRR